MTASMLLNDLGLIAPELILAGGAMALLMVGVFSKVDLQAARLVNTATMALFALAAAAAIWIAPDAPQTGFGGAFVLDALAVYAKAVIYVVGIAVLMLASKFLERERLAKFEYPVLVTLAVLGLSVMVSANDLIGLYLGLELSSLSLYILAAFNRDSLRASEAGLKYFVLGALSSGLLLYGSSLVYGFAGSTNFDAIATAAAADPNVGLIFGLVFVISGLAFKISAAPFHMWTPDVYEGAPTPVVAFFATAPKLAAMALLARVLMEPFGPMVDEWRQVVMVLAVLSMGIGAFGALMQTNIKRLMGYSSIGNIGYMLVGLAAGTQAGVWAVLLYMTLYVFAVVGVFGVILSMRRSEGMVERIEDLSGLAKTRPGLGYAMTGLLFSIGGMPPLVGFFGKLAVFIAAVQAGLLPLVVVAALFSAVSMAYYLKIIYMMWMKEPQSEFLPAPAGVMAVTRIAGIATLALMPVVGFLFARVIQAGGALGG
jgi:NADH-quinone oxidoreductase subunit N